MLQNKEIGSALDGLLLLYSFFYRKLERETKVKGFFLSIQTL